MPTQHVGRIEESRKGFTGGLLKKKKKTTTELNIMAPKSSNARELSLSDPNGMFAGMVVFLVDTGVQTRRLQIWKQKLVQMGAVLEHELTKKVTHIFAMTLEALHQRVDTHRYTGKILLYQWLEDSLKSGEKISGDSYNLKSLLEEKKSSEKSLEENYPKPARVHPDGAELSPHKKIKASPKEFHVNSEDDACNNAIFEGLDANRISKGLPFTSSPSHADLDTPGTLSEIDNTSLSSLPYSPPDLNRNITEIFGELINTYRALGDDRRSFSYYKAIGVIEKVPFKIESADQVKDLPTIGKSLKDHIQEIVNTGKLSKLEHFKTDEKVRTINLFGQVWGVGPATALKLYEKGYRTLADLKNEDSLSSSQKLGLKYFDDINTRIPRHEVQEMELLLQRVGNEILPGVVIVCGGSFRRGKASCGDLDIVITHPDGKSHKGFLTRYVKHLKDLKFLREDLIFSTHSEEGSDSGVDTYFGLCTYPGRELRRRIDVKVYPRDIYAFGLLAWTGNDVLNRRLRIIAESKGYRLDDTGLFLATPGGSSSGHKRGIKSSKSSSSLSLKTEKEVFDFLGYPWLEPHHRNL